MEPQELSELMQRASAGDESAWNAIVDEYSGLLLSVVRGFRLGDAQAADVVQTTWLRLVEHLDELRDPVRLSGWLRTTAFRACLEVVREARRTTPVDPTDSWSEVACTSLERPEDRVLRDDRDAQLREAVAELPERSQHLLSLLVASPPLSYAEIGARMGMPVGSIGPTRARLLTRLRAALEAADVTDLALG